MEKNTKQFTKIEMMLICTCIESVINKDYDIKSMLTDDGFQKLVDIHWKIAKKLLPEVGDLPKELSNKRKKELLAEFRK